MEKKCTSKRQKKGRQSEQDFISDLPDAILVHIFTFLPMEEVVKTGILSRRWDHLWTKVQRICYSSPLSGKREEMDKFTCFVNHTLSLLKCDSIQEFSLDFSDLSPEVVNAGRMEGMRRFALQVDRWIRCAVTKKVKVLYLNLADSKGPMYGFPYKVPGHIFSNDSITELLLCVCRLNPFRPIRWNNLKSLFLYDILLSDELIQNILSGTPLLEVIRLSECKGMRKVIITNPNLKGLALVCSSGPWIELSAPHVQTLEISGDMEQDRLKNVSSLLGGQVIPEGQTIDDSFQNLLRRTFESVRHAIVLGLSTRCLQVLSLLEQKMNVESCSNCNRLELNTCLTKWELPGIKLLLRSSPTLQTLTIQKGNKCGRFCFDDGVFPKYDFDEVNYWNSIMSFPCLRTTLKTVQIFDFTGGSSETAFVEFLLNKSAVLQKMVIHSKKAQDVSGYPPFTSDDMFKFSQKLLSFQRASPSAIVLFS